jgi:hypothetical protein
LRISLEAIFLDFQRRPLAARPTIGKINFATLIDTRRRDRYIP